MSFLDPLINFYYFFEDKWYSLLDQIDKKMPVYKVIEPIDKIIPSFVLFLLLVLFLFILTGYLLQFSSPYEVSFMVSDSDTKVGLMGVKLSGLINDSVFDKSTNSDGEAKVIAEGLKRDLYGSFWQLLTNEEDPIAVTLSANKEGYKGIKEKSIELTNRKAKIFLEKQGIDFDANYPDSTRVKLIDQESRALIIDQENRSYVKFKCNNKTINPQVKTVSDSSDGEIDGVFVLNEKKCAFVVTEAYADGYELESGVSFALPVNKEEHEITLSKISLPTTGTGKVIVTEYNTSPEKRIPGIEVTLSDESGYTTKDLTDNSGVAEFYNMHAGNYTVTAISPDGNYYALTSDANISLLIPLNDTNEIEIKLVKLNPDLVRITNVKFVEDENNSENIKGVKMFLQYVTTNNGQKYANGEIGYCKKGCISDENGVVQITGLDANKAGKLIATAYKEGYVIEIFEPTLFKVGLGPEIIPLKKATLSNTGEAIVYVKSKSTKKPLNGAKTSLYLNSIDFPIKKIKIFDTPKITDSNGRTDYNYLPKGEYYANATFAGVGSQDSNTASIDVGEGVHQIITLNVEVDTAISSIKLSLYDGITREKITNPTNPQVKLYEVLDNIFTPTNLLETLSFSGAQSSFTSSGYEPQKKLLLTIDINGYASNFVTISSLAPGENIYNILMYPSSSLDSNINIFFNGLYEEINEINSLNQANFIDKEKEEYYAKIDVVLTREIPEGELLSMLRIDGPMSTKGIPEKTNYSFNLSESSSCTPQGKQTGINDNNYYFPQQSSCAQGTKIQSGIKWSPNLRKGTYSYVVKLGFNENAADDDEVTLKFRAKENLQNYSSETPLKEKSFYISKPFCDPTDPTCPKIFFVININNNKLGPSTGLKYDPSNKSFKSNNTITLASKQVNDLNVYLYNNSGSSITPQLNLYSFTGFWNKFNGTPSGSLHMGNSANAGLTISHNIPSIINKTRSITKNQTLFPNSLNTTQYLILEAVFGNNEKYYAYINTKALGSTIKIDAEFIAGILNQNLDGQTLSSTDNSPVDLEKAVFTAMRNCNTTHPTIAVSPDGVELRNQPLSVIDSSNYFEGIIPGIYAYKKDCIEIKVTPTNTNFNETTKTIYAGFGGSIDPTLTCIKVKGPNNTSEDFNMEWNTNAKISVTNNCPNSVKVFLESDLIITPSNEVTLDTGRVQEYTLNAKNKTFSPTEKFSDILGVFPIMVKGKPESATKRKFTIVDFMRVHVANQNECFIISKDLFDFTSTSNDNSFQIDNNCQYTLIEDYYIPKAMISSFGVDLNMYKTNQYGAVDFDWDIILTGGTYSSSYTTQVISSRGKVYSTPINPDKIVDLNEHKKLYGLRIDMSEDDMDTNEIWVKWNDKYNDENIFGATIDGNIIITPITGPSYSINPSVDYNVDTKSCECDGINTLNPQACTVSAKNYCVSGMEQPGLYEGEYYTNIHFTIPQTKIKWFDFNLISGKDLSDLLYYVTPFGTKELQVLNITPSAQEGTKNIISGDFRIYPQEGLTYILQDLGSTDGPIIDLTDTEYYSINNPSVKVETSNIRSNGTNLPNGTIIVWVEGRFLKARFFGEDNPEYNSGTIPMKLEKTFAEGTQYSIINIKDYVNNGKTRR